jgi:uncharacterized protein YndB with AHSA1/START domain
MNPRRVAPFRFDRSWQFPIPPQEFWDTVSRTDQFPLWWGWLRSFDSGGLVAGATTRFAVQGALPYKLEFLVTVDRVVEPQLVETTVAGHLAGPATLTIAPDGDGCRARLAWVLEPRDAVVRRLAIVSHPLLAWSHDQVVNMGVTQFRRRLARARPGDREDDHEL